MKRFATAFTCEAPPLASNPVLLGKNFCCAISPSLPLSLSLSLFLCPLCLSTSTPAVEASLLDKNIHAQKMYSDGSCSRQSNISGAGNFLGFLSPAALPGAPRLTEFNNTLRLRHIWKDASSFEGGITWHIRQLYPQHGVLAIPKLA